MYTGCKLVQNVCVYADATHHRPVAIVVPTEHTLRQFSLANHFASEDSTLESLCGDQRIQAEVHRELLAVGKLGGLVRIELIEGVIMIPEEWTTENARSIWISKAN